MSRQSIFPQQSPSDQYWHALDACAHALHAANTSLDAAVTTLHQGTYDFPRMQAVLSTRRCFEVVPESEIAAAQRDLADAIEPQIKELIARAELGLADLHARETHLRARVEKRAVVAATAARTAAARETAATTSQGEDDKLEALRRKKVALLEEGRRLDAEIGKAKAALVSV